MSRSFWKGYLKLSLVTCPVTMMPATSERQKLRFHTLNRSTKNRVKSRFVDAETNKPVAEDDEVAGYETGENSYVMLEDDELDAVALESTRTIDIETFVSHESIGCIWYDTPHYLMPDGPVGEEAFSVIREAMSATGTVGISRVVLYRRERAVMIEPRERGLVLWTLRYGDEVRDPALYFDKIPTAQPEEEVVSLFSKLIGKQTKSWDPKVLKDPIQEQLQEIIAAKKKKRKIVKAKMEPHHSSNVINIMDALRDSLGAGKKAPKSR